MIVVHRISIRASEKQGNALEKLGVKLPPGNTLPGGGAPHIVFDVEENHPNWHALERLFHEWDVGDFVMTRFSADEISAASWLELVPDWHHGYPQPDEDFGFLRVTYDLGSFCTVCGMGLRQKAPFQMKREPKWGRRSIMQLNWVFGEYFVTPSIWSAVFAPRGVGRRPVTNRKGVELTTVVQLVVEEEVGVATDGLASEACAICGRVKYLPVTRGFFPALRTRPAGSMVKTREHFGSGASAHPCVLVSQELRRAMHEASMRGASFMPVADRPTFAS
jgi:hypothetical protein